MADKVEHDWMKVHAPISWCRRCGALKILSSYCEPGVGETTDNGCQPGKVHIDKMTVSRGAVGIKLG